MLLLYSRFRYSPDTSKIRILICHDPPSTSQSYCIYVKAMDILNFIKNTYKKKKPHRCLPTRSTFLHTGNKNHIWWPWRHLKHYYRGLEIGTNPLPTSIIKDIYQYFIKTQPLFSFIPTGPYMPLPLPPHHQIKNSDPHPWPSGTYIHCWNNKIRLNNV